MNIGALVTLWKVSNKNLVLKAKIEEELKSRVQENQLISREYVFNVCKMKSHAITVFFIPTTKEFEMYGPNLTIDMILTDDEIIELAKNLPALQTQGYVKAKVLVTDNLSDEQIESALNIGFHTKSVYEVIHL